MSEAVKEQCLSLTVPWVVEYMSMMDSHALQVPEYSSLLCQMVAVYRWVCVCVCECVRERERDLKLCSKGLL